MKIGIVTGASSGMGIEFALQLEQRFDLDEIWLIARRKERLEQLQKRLSRVRSVVLPMDMTSQNDMRMLMERIEKTSPDIRILVNNAGYGVFGNFGERSLDTQFGMIDLNVKALVELTYRCIPYMQSGAIIIQLGSLFGLLPGVAGWTVYSASKAFIKSFAAGLHYELKPRGIRVVSVNPGGVRTEFGDVAGKSDFDIPSGGSEPADVVRQAIDDAEKGKVYSIFGSIANAVVLMARLLPTRWLLQIFSVRDTHSHMVTQFYTNLKPKLMKNLDKILKPVRQVLAERYGKEFAETIIAETKKEYEDLIPAFPYVGGVNMRMMTNKITWSAHCLALYRVMQRHGKSVDESGTLICDAVEKNWKTFPNNLIAILSGIFIFTQLVTGPLRREAARSQKGRYPQGGVMAFIDGDGDSFNFGLDYMQCPIHKFFHAQGADELTPYLCRTDFIYSRACRTGLKRTTTLAGGGTKCDFRWKRRGDIVDAEIREKA